MAQDHGQALCRSPRRLLSELPATGVSSRPRSSTVKRPRSWPERFFAQGAAKPGTIKAQDGGTDSDLGLRRGVDDGVRRCRESNVNSRPGHVSAKLGVAKLGCAG